METSKVGTKTVATPADNMRRPMRPLVHMVNCFLRRRLAVLLGALVLPGIASAREIIVAPSGGDVTSVAAGGGAAPAGDHVTARAGAYNQARSVRRGDS